MLLLALTSLFFGLIASLMFSAAPFVVGNLLAAIGIISLGFVKDWTFAYIGATLVVGMVCLQGGFFLGTISKLGNTRRPDGLPERKPRAEGIRSDASSMDRTR